MAKVLLLRHEDVCMLKLTGMGMASVGCSAGGQFCHNANRLRRNVPGASTIHRVGWIWCQVISLLETIVAGDYCWINADRCTLASVTMNSIK